MIKYFNAMPRLFSIMNIDFNIIIQHSKCYEIENEPRGDYDSLINQLEFLTLVIICTTTRHDIAFSILQKSALSAFLFSLALPTSIRLWLIPLSFGDLSLGVWYSRDSLDWEIFTGF